MTTTEPRGPDTFVISLPTTWIEVPANPEELVAFVRDRAERQLPVEQRESIEFRRVLVLLRRLAEQVQQGGIVFTAVSSEEVALGTGDPTDDEPYFVVAYCWLATMHAEQFGA